MEDDVKTCWVCFSSEVEHSTSWTRPCRCRGATRWVHQHCLQRWIDEKQHGDLSASVACSICGTDYIVKYPPASLLYRILQFADGSVRKLCRYATWGAFIAGFYWCGMTFGAVTVAQVVGRMEAMQLLTETNPLVLMISLPSIPVLLVLAKFVRWDDMAFAFWQRYTHRIPYLNKLLGMHDIPQWRIEYDAQFNAPVHISLSRVLAGAISFPSVSVICGRLLFFTEERPKWQRTLLGGLTFILGKGIINLVYQHMKYIRNLRRVIADFDESSIDTPPIPMQDQIDSDD